jgi:hypothetical protein
MRLYNIIQFIIGFYIIFLNIKTFDCSYYSNDTELGARSDGTNETIVTSFNNVTSRPNETLKLETTPFDLNQLNGLITSVFNSFNDTVSSIFNGITIMMSSFFNKLSDFITLAVSPSNLDNRVLSSLESPVAKQALNKFNDTNYSWFENVSNGTDYFSYWTNKSNETVLLLNQTNVTLLDTWLNPGSLLMSDLVNSSIVFTWYDLSYIVAHYSWNNGTYLSLLYSWSNGSHITQPLWINSSFTRPFYDWLISKSNMVPPFWVNVPLVTYSFNSMNNNANEIDSNITCFDESNCIKFVGPVACINRKCKCIFGKDSNEFKCQDNGDLYSIYAKTPVYRSLNQSQFLSFYEINDFKCYQDKECVGMFGDFNMVCINERYI